MNRISTDIEQSQLAGLQVIPGPQRPFIISDTKHRSLENLEAKQRLNDEVGIFNCLTLSLLRTI